MQGWTPDEIADLVAHIPRVPINNHVPRSSLDAKLLWAPEEIGEFVGNIVRNDMELDHVIGVLDKLALTVSTRVYCALLYSRRDSTGRAMQSGARGRNTSAT